MPLLLSSHRWPDCRKEFGMFSWVTFVSSGGIVNLASEGDYRPLLFLSSIEIEVRVYVCGFICHHTYQISSSARCLLEFCLPLNTEGTPKIFFATSVLHLSPGSWSEQYWVWASLFPTPLLVEVGALKGATTVVSQEEAEEVEEKLGLE